jgi:hypothetical protein
MSEAAVVAGCASSVDTDCTCPSTAFKDALGSCLQCACTEDDITGMSTSFILLGGFQTRLSGTRTNFFPPHQLLENCTRNGVERRLLNKVYIFIST